MTKYYTNPTSGSFKMYLLDRGKESSESFQVLVVFVREDQQEIVGQQNVSCTTGEEEYKLCS